MSRFVNDGTLKPENLTKEFFDYVLLDKGDITLAVSTSKLSEDVISSIAIKLRYLDDSNFFKFRQDLVQNHLSFFVLNHVAIFEKKLWPKEMVDLMVLKDGAKMSKSMGNIIPLQNSNQRLWCRPN